MRISTLLWGWMMNTTPSKAQQKQWRLPTAHLHPHLGLRAPRWNRTKPLTSLKVTSHSAVASFLPKQKETWWSWSCVQRVKGSLGEIVWEGGSAWNVHCHCQWSAAEQSWESFWFFFCDTVCFDPINHKNTVAPAATQTKSGERARPDSSISAAWIFHDDETSKSDWYY